MVEIVEGGELDLLVKMVGSRSRGLYEFDVLRRYGYPRLDCVGEGGRKEARVGGGRVRVTIK